MSNPNTVPDYFNGDDPITHTSPTFEVRAFAEYPNLAGVINAEEIETIGSNKFKASYLNWARTMNHMHENAPGWLPYFVPNSDGGMVHEAPDGTGYLLIGFRYKDGQETPPAPQAVMDNRNDPIALDEITARDITDTHRRGLCMVAAMHFGLAYELWAKDPVESQHAKREREEQNKADEAARAGCESALDELRRINPERAKSAEGMMNQKSPQYMLAMLGKALAEENAKLSEEQAEEEAAK